MHGSSSSDMSSLLWPARRAVTSGGQHAQAGVAVVGCLVQWAGWFAVQLAAAGVCYKTGGNSSMYRDCEAACALGAYSWGAWMHMGARLRALCSTSRQPARQSRAPINLQEECAV